MGSAIKNRYFTPQNIVKKSQEIYKYVENITKIKKNSYKSVQSALLICDMQNIFLDENSHAFIPSSPTIITNIKKIIEKYRKNKLLIIFTQHINTTENALNMKKWWHRLIQKNDNLSKIIDIFYPIKETIIEKNQYDAFLNTNLENILNTNNIKQIIITGVMTHLCCETTARSAFMKGFEVFFPIDATATYNEFFHTSTILNLAHGFANIVFTENITNNGYI